MFAQPAKPNTKPNIVFVVMDNLGYGELLPDIRQKSIFARRPTSRDVSARSRNGEITWRSGVIWRHLHVVLQLNSVLVAKWQQDWGEVFQVRPHA